MSFVFNNTNSGNVQVNQGQYVNATQNKQEDKPVRSQILCSVEQIIKDEAPPTEATEVISELTAVESMTQEEVASEEGKSRISSLCERLAPWGPQIARAALAFGDASLKSLASTNPLICGIMAMIDQIKQESPQ